MFRNLFKSKKKTETGKDEKTAASQAEQNRGAAPNSSSDHTVMNGSETSKQNGVTIGSTSSMPHGSNGATTNAKSSEGKNKSEQQIDIDALEAKWKETGQYTKREVLTHNLPQLRNIQDPEKRKQILICKLRLCCVVYTFGPDEQKNENEVRGIERKRVLLTEIVEYISTNSWWSEDTMNELLQVLRSNLFRALPNDVLQPPSTSNGDEGEEPYQDPSWPHLKLVYELCLRILTSSSIDKQAVQVKLDDKFLYQIIQLFESEDPRERDHLKILLHRIYGRFMPLRTSLRLFMSHEFHKYVYSKSRGVNGLADLLDIFSSIVTGFSIPLKAEHKEFLWNVLIPMHKCDKCELYIKQLSDCCVLFANKDQTLAPTILGGLLKFWPHLSPKKQGLFLQEMASIITALVEHKAGFEYEKHRIILMSTLDKMLDCVGSTNFEVAEAAIAVWKSNVIISLSKREKDYMWRKLFALLKENIRAHWKITVVQKSEQLYSFYEELDTEYWRGLSSEFEEKQKQLANVQVESNKDVNFSSSSVNDSHSHWLSIEDRFTKQVSLVHEFDQRQLQVSRQHKSIKRAGLWEEIRVLAQTKTVGTTNFNTQVVSLDSPSVESKENHP